ncbi:hypothetical protein [Falsiroseomonas stagni]|uniref:Uncharacterized protein n=1 Tax=Falsiroseomonas stagni DSM 19981 TaxID=1123062 RepID=A0A1I3Z377_9PROT|nr:hypothetical protein [Falsiroseomonas stagni]SFK38508.1 hypothetical protein SAMN02745775_102105 [Falsiroseomonas stagni DSM 19981]
MARRPRRDDADRDPADGEAREYTPPSRRTSNVVIGVLVSAGLFLIAYFILELRLEDMGGTAGIIVMAIVFILVGRAAPWR